MADSDENLYRISGPDGTDVLIPIEVDDASDLYLRLESDQAIKDYYADNGYVVLRNVIPKEMCAEALTTFDREVKSYDGYIYRQATANPERHRLTQYGYMENSILNIQDLDSRRFRDFKRSGIEILTHPKVQDALQVLFGEPAKLVQSMFFEGNPATWAHQDTYYLDSEHIGSMIAAWVAVEDIRPGAGRFFVYPGSHKIDMQKNGGDFDIAFNHSRYKQLVLDVIRREHLELRAPALRAGDMLLWGGRTIHGSLQTTQPEFSRSSLTAHYIPDSHRFLQFQSRIKPLKLKTLNGMQVNHPKDQDVLLNKTILRVETRFPRTFRSVKKAAIKLVTR